MKSMNSLSKNSSKSSNSVLSISCTVISDNFCFWLSTGWDVYCGFCCFHWTCGFADFDVAGFAFTFTSCVLLALAASAAAHS